MYPVQFCTVSYTRVYYKGLSQELSRAFNKLHSDDFPIYEYKTSTLSMSWSGTPKIGLFVIC